MAVVSGGGFFDLPDEVYRELCADLDHTKTKITFVESGYKSIYQFKIEKVQCYTQDTPTGKKQYVIRLDAPNFDTFTAEFSQNDDNTTVDFVRRWKSHNSIKSLKNANAETCASKWFANLLSEQKLCFNQIEMEILPKSEKAGTRYCTVKTLHITIPNEPYEDGLLEWWLEKFRDGIKLLTITSTATQKINIPDKPGIFRATNLKLEGSYEIPIALFPRIPAENITFVDSSETSIVNYKVLCLILNDWLAVLGTRREMKFEGNYEEADIEKKVEDFLVEKKSTLQKVEDLTREYLFGTGNGSATIIFYKSEKDLHLKIIPIEPA